MFQLRELEKKDLPNVNQWRNNAELIAFLGAPFRYINLEVDEKWFENYMGNRGNAIRCAIVQTDVDEILGLISLVSIDYINQSAELHIMIGDEKNQEHGIGTFAIRTMIQHAFHNMNLQRIEVAVLESNKRARHVYEKIGFQQEGIKRNAKYKNGCFVNMYLYAILRQDFSGGGVSQFSKLLCGFCIYTIGKKKYY